MEKDRFKDLLFEMLNEHGENEMEMEDVDLHYKEDLLIVQIKDKSKFKIKVMQA